MHPEEIPTESLNPGQVGYFACNMKQSSEGIHLYFILCSTGLYSISCVRLTAHIGDTIHRVGEIVEPMAGFQPTKAMVCFCYFFALLL
jgi:translation elongation factor EF-4